jgi:sortase A
VIGVAAVACIVLVLAGQAVAVSRLQARAARNRPAHARSGAPAAADLPADGGWLVNVLRRRRWLRRSLSFASVAVTLVAVGMIGYPFYTNLYADRVQSRLRTEFSSEQLRSDYETCRQVGVQNAACQIRDGDSLTRIRIPDIEVDVVVVEGVSASALRAGAGHYPSTPLPCEAGNVAIAGHRTTYGRPFHDLDLLDPGDEIHVQIPIGECTYRVVDVDGDGNGHSIVSPNDVGVIAGTSDNRLTLTTCHPKGSARQRLIITAELVASPFVTA